MKGQQNYLVELALSPS